MLWRRADGRLSRDVPGTRRIMPYIMRTRNESAVYFEQTADLQRTDAFIRAFNEAHPGAQITVQHVVMWAVLQVMDRYPTMNRFVAGGRLYDRDGIWFSYSAKQKLREGAPIVVIKRRFDPAEPFAAMVEDMQRQLNEDRFSGRRSTSDQEIDLIMRLPGLARRLVMAIGRAADAFGVLPRAMIERDPMYASAFFANLASLGMEPCYHHLYEYGTIGVFGVIGRPGTAPGSPTSGPGRRRSMILRWTFDERVEDGLVAGYALKRARQIIEDPVAAGLLTGRERSPEDGSAGPGFPIDSAVSR